MANYKITISIPAADADKAQNLATLLQSVAKVVAHDDMVRLLSKVKANPAIVKTALKFI